MPLYDYRCDKCNMIWEESRTISDRDIPCNEKCPHCKKKGSVKKHVGGFPGIGVDSTLTANKKTGGQWNEIMSKIKNGLPERYHKNIDRDVTGTKWKG